MNTTQATPTHSVRYSIYSQEKKVRELGSGLKTAAIEEIGNASNGIVNNMI